MYVNHYNRYYGKWQSNLSSEILAEILADWTENLDFGDADCYLLAESWVLENEVLHMLGEVNAGDGRVAASDGGRGRGDFARPG